MNFNKYFALFTIVILGLLCQHAAQAHSIFWDLKHDAERDIHKVDEKVDNIKNKAEGDVHEVGRKLDNIGHKVEKTAKKAYKVYKVVQDVETAGKVIEVAGAVAHVVEKF